MLKYHRVLFFWFHFNYWDGVTRIWLILPFTRIHLKLWLLSTLFSPDLIGGCLLLGAPCEAYVGRLYNSWIITLESRISMETMVSMPISSFWTRRILSWWVSRCEGPQPVSMPRTASNFSKMPEGGRMSLWRLAFRRTIQCFRQRCDISQRLAWEMNFSCAALAGHDCREQR